MRRRNLGLASMVGIATVFLATVGVIASVALGKGRPPVSQDTTTTQTQTQTTTQTAALPPTTAPSSSKALVCHRTHSKKKPFRTINVSVNAVAAHLAHGDSLGACLLVAASASTSGPGNGHGHANGHSK